MRFFEKTEKYPSKSGSMCVSACAMLIESPRNTKLTTRNCEYALMCVYVLCSSWYNLLHVNIYKLLTTSKHMVNVVVLPKWETKNEKVSCDAVAVTVPILTMLAASTIAAAATRTHSITGSSMPLGIFERERERKKWCRKEMRSTTVQSIIYIGKQSTKSKLFFASLFSRCNHERKTFSIFISFLFYLKYFKFDYPISESTFGNSRSSISRKYCSFMKIVYAQ